MFLLQTFLINIVFELEVGTESCFSVLFFRRIRLGDVAFDFFPCKFSACSKPSSRVINVKHFIIKQTLISSKYPRTQQCVQDAD